MNFFSYYKAIILSKLTRKGNEYIVSKMRDEGMSIGEGTHIFSNIAASEPYLVSIGKNCTISTEVNFITHDASVGIFMGREKYSDVAGRIIIGDNCFIGSRVLIMYGVTLPDNTLVAAGSVVTKSISETGCIIGGNPAKIIGRLDDYLEKNSEFFLSLHNLNSEERKKKILTSNLLKR